MKPVHAGQGTIQGTILCRREDQCGEILVAQEGNLRTLYFGNGIAQSSIRTDRPALLLEDYNEAMMCSLLFNSSPRSILLIGLGGCSLVHFLLKALPDCILDVVEIRRNVIDLAREYFFLPSDNPRLNIFQGNGIEFIASSDARTYDMIILDAFDETGPSMSFLTETFFSSCRLRLSGNGIFAMNAWNSPEHDFHGLYNTVRVAFEGNALKLLLTESYRNAVIFGLKDAAMRTDLPASRNKAAELQKRFGIPYRKYWKYLYWQNFDEQDQ